MIPGAKRVDAPSFGPHHLQLHRLTRPTLICSPLLPSLPLTLCPLFFFPSFSSKSISSLSFSPQVSPGCEPTCSGFGVQCDAEDRKGCCTGHLGTRAWRPDLRTFCSVPRFLLQKVRLNSSSPIGGERVMEGLRGEGGCGWLPLGPQFMNPVLLDRCLKGAKFTVPSTRICPFGRVILCFGFAHLFVL